MMDWKDLEGNGYGLIEASSIIFPRGTEGNEEES
jgi:hypothetical protein